MNEEIYKEFRSFRQMAWSPPKDIAIKFADLAEDLDRELPDGDDKDSCLRLLLEARDCGVRSAGALVREGTSVEKTGDAGSG